MSGHSKWSNIHRKKEANDKVRSGVFTKLAKGIMMAVKKGGGIGEVDKNYSLRLAVELAKAANMPKDNIERAIAKGMGKEADQLEEIVIEGYADGGVGVICQVVTDNRNRSVSEIRQIFEKNGGKMGEMGSVMYMFELQGGEYIAKYTLQVDNPGKVHQLLEALSDYDDIVEVYANLGSE